mmetsp:Transcript_26540/g.63192  ORF Transcript_26540/g.63192 Transcript_26540/m.63192 type:complete len:511 (+) Transcript_26540:167-1699(+)
MPCLIITGHPCAGKTTLAKKLREVALQHYSPSVIDDVILINEESELLHGNNNKNNNDHDHKQAEENSPRNDDDYTKESWYINQLEEKQTRGTLKAAFDRVVGRKESSTATAATKTSTSSSLSNSKRRTLVILDSMNYIKGFRYELHCISKAAGEQHGVLWVLNRRQDVEEWNSACKHYSPDLLKELISRFEPPDDRNRWDKPLFTVDVAPNTTSSSNNNNNNTSIKAASAALQDSVYNMYTLSDVLPGGSTSPTDNGTAETVSKTASSNKPRSVKKSAFSRAPKKSAFTRKSNTKKAAMPAAKPQQSSIIDGIPLALSETNHGQEEMVIEASNLRSSTDKIAATKSVAYSQLDNSTIAQTGSSTTATSQSHPPPPPPKSLDEHLRNVLDVFLLKTEALKEGTSTQSMVAGQANVLANLDSITARTMTSIIKATQQHQPPCEVQVDVPVVATMKTSENTTTITMKYPRHVGLGELRQTRKKFLQWSASHPPDDSSEYAIAKSFIKFVEDSL